jgi:two-component system, NarL family, response regulator NreC
VSRPVRILIADDHAVVRQGLKLLISSQPDMTVVGEAPDGAAALRQADALNPDIVVMDVSMPDMNGLIATRTLKQRRPEVAIIALTRHDDNTFLQELLRAGASGYVLKQSNPVEFLQAIRAVAAGGVYLDPAMTPRVADGLLTRTARNPNQPRTPITERESDVLRLIAIGHSNKEVAAQLNISVKTVEVHKANAMKKLGLAGRVDLIRYGMLQGWLYDT